MAPSSRRGLPVVRQRALAQRFVALQIRRAAGLRARLRVFFRQQSNRVVARYTGTKTATLDTPPWMGRVAWLPELKEINPDDLMPPDEDRRLQIVLQPDLRDHYLQANRLASGLVDLDPIDPNDRRVQEYLLTGSERVVDINDVTRDEIRLALALGGERGYNQYQIAHGVPDEGFRGLDDVVDQTYRNRSDTIVRTELAFASSQASLDTYDEADIEWVDVRDGPGCGWTDHDDPDEADGSRRSIEDAEEYPIAHPNCRRVFLPAFGPPAE